MNQITSGLKPVEDNTLRAQVARQILNMVTSGQFQPGQKLTEQQLASELQVSRAPLREAVRELADQGILVSKPYRGLHVRPISRADLEELYSLRAAFERFAFTQIWPHRTPDMLADLDTRMGALFAVQTTGDQSRAISAEIAFHSWVYDASRHKLLISHWARLAPLVRIYMSLHHTLHGSQGRFRDMTQDYRDLAHGDDLDAMLAHIHEHMRSGMASVLEALPAES